MGARQKYTSDVELGDIAEKFIIIKGFIAADIDNYWLFLMSYFNNYQEKNGWI